MISGTFVGSREKVVILHGKEVEEIKARISLGPWRVLNLVGERQRWSRQ